jgi:carboxymethylenebutenolidase
LVAALGFDHAICILDAAATQLRREGLAVGAVGYCWGGTIALLANQRLGLPAASYYGARNVQFLDEPLRAPMLFHFGELDDSIPARDIAAHREKLPDAEIRTYPTGHAFNRDVDPKVYDDGSARLAHARTMQFFARALH